MFLLLFKYIMADHWKATNFADMKATLPRESSAAKDVSSLITWTDTKENLQMAGA